MTWEMTSQLYGLLITMGLTVILLFSLWWFVIRKQEMGEAPRSKIMVLLESYYQGFYKLMDGLSGEKLRWSYLYLFGLFNFIMLNSLVDWIGLEPATTTIMFTLPLSIITFIGIFIIGIGTKGLWQFIRHKYVSDPMEIILQFAPVISMSVRLFASTFAGAIICNVPWIIMHGIVYNASSGGSAWGNPIVAWGPAIQIIVFWVWKIVDTLLGTIQAFVFIALTIILWVSDSGPSWSPAKRKELRIKAAKIAESKKRAQESMANKKVVDNNQIKSSKISLDKKELKINKIEKNKSKSKTLERRNDIGGNNDR